MTALNVELIEGTIENPADVDKAVAGVDAICHLAAAFQGGGPFTNQQYLDINVRGAFNMLEAARQHAPSLQHFFYASTDAIYDKYISIDPDSQYDFPPLRRGEWWCAVGGRTVDRFQ
ncbi:MAG: NAD-dependent epimerase/dehydratase family protein [Caldilineaceae bacterium]